MLASRSKVILRRVVRISLAWTQELQRHREPHRLIAWVAAISRTSAMHMFKFGNVWHDAACEFHIFAIRDMQLVRHLCSIPWKRIYCASEGWLFNGSRGRFFHRTFAKHVAQVSRELGYWILQTLPVSKSLDFALLCRLKGLLEEFKSRVVRAQRGIGRLKGFIGVSILGALLLQLSALPWFNVRIDKYMLMDFCIYLFLEGTGHNLDEGNHMFVKNWTGQNIPWIDELARPDTADFRGIADAPEQLENAICLQIYWYYFCAGNV